MQNFIAQLNTISNIIDLMALPTKSPKEFDLQNFGSPAAEIQVVRRLLDTAYSEVVSLINQVPRKDSIPVADRGRSLSDFDSEYDGTEEVESTFDSIEAQLELAIINAAVVHRYAQHLGAVKQGGAEWAINGFVSSPEWVAIDPKDTQAVQVCHEKGDQLCAWIAAGDNRIELKSEYVRPVIKSFGQWLTDTFAKANKTKVWSQKLAQAIAVADNETKGLMSVEIDVAKASIHRWAALPAFNRNTSRLEEAVASAADTKWRFDFSKAQLPSSAVAWLLLPYSPKFQQDRADFQQSQELMDAITALMDAQREALTSDRLVEARKAAKHIATLLSFATEEVRELVTESDAAEALNNVLLAQDLKKSVAARARQLIYAEVNMDIREQAAVSVLQQRSLEAKEKALAKRQAALDALLNPTTKAKKPAAAKKPKLVAAAVAAA